MTRLLVLLGLVGASVIASSISGRVLDESGSPLPKARISVLFPSDGRIVSSTVTDDRGDYRIPSIPAGKYLIKAEAVGFIDLTYGPVKLPYAGGYEREIRLPLADTPEGGIWLDVKAVGRLEAEGAALTRAELCFLSDSARKCVVTDANGEYVITLDPGVYSVQAKSHKGTPWVGHVSFPSSGYYENYVEVVPARRP